ncbi:MAG TPA: prolyl oligopeptidase family serine peptidase [Usitatibacter sp.]|nr:prolyl oligopeptidase family serine peptidase [Usitatibacter sp.]
MVIALAALVAAVTVEDLARVRDIDSLSVSPDGRRVAAFVRHADPGENRYRSEWLVADLESRRISPAGDGGELGPRVMFTGHTPGAIDLRESHWSPDGKSFAYLLTRSGETQLWKSDLGGEQVQVTRNAADVRDFAWSEDGRSLFFTVGSPREALRAQEESRARSGYRYDHDLWTATDLLAPRTIVPPETKLTTWVAPMDGASERVANEAEQAAFARVRAVKPPVAKPVPESLRADGNDFAHCVAGGEERLVCVRQSILRPPHLVVIDLRTSTLDVIADPNERLAGMPFKLERFELDVPKLEWNEPGGTLEGLYPKRTYGWLILPAGFDPSRKYPLFVDAYMATGFRPLGNEHPLHAYAASDMVVMRLQLPFPSDAFKRFGSRSQALLYSEELGFPHFSMLMGTIVAALDAVSARGFIDATRVGIGGVSHGSFIPMHLMQKHDRIAAISISSPGFGPHSYYSGTKHARDWVAKMGYPNWGPKPDGAGREFWRKIDLADHVDQVEAPMLMQLAAHEAYGNQPLIRHLADAGLPYDAYIFPRETHIKWQPAHIHAIQQRNLDWFRFWLQDHEDASAGKAGQYARWRELRQMHCGNPRALRKACP